MVESGISKWMSRCGCGLGRSGRAEEAGEGRLDLLEAGAGQSRCHDRTLNLHISAQKQAISEPHTTRHTRHSSTYPRLRAEKGASREPRNWMLVKPTAPASHTFHMTFAAGRPWRLITALVRLKLPSTAPATLTTTSDALGLAPGSRLNEICAAHTIDQVSIGYHVE